MDALQPGWSTSDLVKGVGYNATYGTSISKYASKFAVGSVIGKKSTIRGHAGSGITRTEDFELESRSDESLRGSDGVIV